MSRVSAANVLPTAPPSEGVEKYYPAIVQQATELYSSLPTTTNAENFPLTEISKIVKEIAEEAEHYRLVLKKYIKKKISESDSLFRCLSWRVSIGF